MVKPCPKEMKCDVEVGSVSVYCLMFWIFPATHC